MRLRAEGKTTNDRICRVSGAYENSWRKAMFAAAFGFLENQQMQNISRKSAVEMEAHPVINRAYRIKFFCEKSQFSYLHLRGHLFALVHSQNLVF